MRTFVHTARSRSPSLSKSPSAIEDGLVVVVRVVAELSPFALPNAYMIVPAAGLAWTTSSLPSALRSPAAITWVAPMPATVGTDAGANVPSPFPLPPPPFLPPPPPPPPQAARGARRRERAARLMDVELRMGT